LPNNRAVSICLTALLAAAACVSPNEGQLVPDGSPTLDGPEPDLAPDAGELEATAAPRDAAADGATDGAADLAPPAGPVDSATGPDAPDGPPALLATGQACKVGGQCTSGYCVDEICCASSCSGACNACARVHTGQPDGTCAPAQAGADPHNDCVPGAQPCGTDGTCDGAGKCRHASRQVECGQEACANGM